MLHGIAFGIGAVIAIGLLRVAWAIFIACMVADANRLPKAPKAPLTPEQKSRREWRQFPVLFAR